jgi:hypothetical protein
MTPDEMKSELARILSTMPYGVLLGVARELYEMNADDNAGLRDMTSKYGMAETLYDWAESVASGDDQ